jgi:SNF2 family DNA or RNA helicase
VLSIALFLCLVGYFLKHCFVQSETKEQARARKAKHAQQLQEQNRIVEKGHVKAADARKRFLGELTEIFDHFMKPGAVLRRSSSSTPKSPGTPNRRGQPQRKREQDEDAELLEAAEAEEEHHEVTHISVSPAWITNGTMRSYQLDGLKWLIQLYENNVNGVLADEMGLGKTLQTISLLGYLKNVLGLHGPHLVIVPNSTLANWQKEFTRWCPSLRAFVFHGDKEKRARLKAEKLVAGKLQCIFAIFKIHSLS